jgi:RNA polymerase subunit RPABC4/transcription elongation factor Spt4
MEQALLDAIRHQINAGDRDGARLELAKLLTSDPENTGAWALLAILLKDPAEQVECYRQILRINPDDRQAAAWIEALSRHLPKETTREEPPVPEKWTLQCTNCGGVTEVRFVGEMRDKRAFCPNCGSRIDLPDAFQRVERRREQEQLPGGAGRILESLRIETQSDYLPGEGSTGQVGDIEEVLQDLDLPEIEEEASRQAGKQGMQAEVREQTVRAPGKRTEDRGLVDRLLRRVRGDALDDEDEAAALNQLGELAQPGRLGPEDIIRLAGGPLPPEERRECRNCGAVVSRSESRCPWCSAPLSAAEDS